MQKKIIRLSFFIVLRSCVAIGRNLQNAIFKKKWVKLFSRYLKKIDESKRNKEIV